MKGVAAGAAIRAALEAKCKLPELIPLIYRCLLRSGGVVGEALALARLPLASRPRGEAVSEVMPLPFVSSPSERSGSHVSFKSSMHLLIDIWIVLLNTAHSLDVKKHVCTFTPSRAQARMVQRPAVLC